jgi:hypothetical protein
MFGVRFYGKRRPGGRIARASFRIISRDRLAGPKRRIAAYYVCYETDDFEGDTNSLTGEGFTIIKDGDPPLLWTAGKFVFYTPGR